MEEIKARINKVCGTDFVFPAHRTALLPRIKIWEYMMGTVLKIVSVLTMKAQLLNSAIVP